MSFWTQCFFFPPTKQNHETVCPVPRWFGYFHPSKKSCSRSVYFDCGGWALPFSRRRRTRALHDVAFADRGVAAETNDPDIVVLQVQRHALHPRRELHHLARLNLVQAVDARDAVAHAQDAADFVDIQRAVVPRNSFLKKTGQLLRGDPRAHDRRGLEPASDRTELRPGRILGRQAGHRAQGWGDFKRSRPAGLGPGREGAEELSRGAAHHTAGRRNAGRTCSVACARREVRGGGEGGTRKPDPDRMKVPLDPCGPSFQ